MTYAPRILDGILTTEERDRIFIFYENKQEVDAVFKEEIIQKVMKVFSYSKVTLTEATRVVEDAFAYYSALAASPHHTKRGK